MNGNSINIVHVFDTCGFHPIDYFDILKKVNLAVFFKRLIVGSI